MPPSRSPRPSAIVPSRHPDAPAITDGDRVPSRAEVDGLVDLAAGPLPGAGVTPASVVALSGTNSAELLMTFFAIWRLAAIPLPLHPRMGPA